MSPLAPSHQVQLKELFDTLKDTHGGPAFISSAELNGLRRKVLGERQHELCKEFEGESTYASRCAWVMNQLEDPYAAYLSPSQVGTLRERFHGAVGVGLKVDEHQPNWWRRCCVIVDLWRGTPSASRQRARGTVMSVEAGSPAERAGIVVRCLRIERTDW